MCVCVCQMCPVVRIDVYIVLCIRMDKLIHKFMFDKLVSWVPVCTHSSESTVLLFTPNSTCLYV